MSDHSQRLTVVLDKDYRVDDLEHLMDAIRMMKGVVEVAADVSNPQDFMAKVSARAEIEKKIFEVFHDV